MGALRANISKVAWAAALVVLVWAWVARPPVSWTFAVLATVGITAVTITNGFLALRRLAVVVPVLLVVSVLAFLLVASLPGDPAVVILGFGATPEAVADLREQLGLDLPIWSRYLHWLSNVVVGDLGFSNILNEEVADGISRTLTPTLQLVLYSMTIALAIAVPLGIYTAYRANSKFDRTANFTMLGFIALPNFVFAVLLVLILSVGGFNVFGVTVGGSWLPAARYVHFGDSALLHFKHMLLPSVSLALGFSAVLMRLLRAEAIEMLRRPFIDLARSKGISPNRVLWRHALRPSTLTPVTALGLTVGALVGGTLIIEVLFGLPGVGSYILTAVVQRDFLVVQGGTLVISTLFIVVLTLIDFIYLALDPRLRAGERRVAVGST